ncbi:hypothetical protein GZL_00870 [Streptomyces sp. 769]|nr:hypothetical protein GZL_00870 [Streptomyces sp. 769]
MERVTERVTVRPESYPRAAARPGFDTGNRWAGTAGRAAWDAAV